jgi:hypothetical protein
MRLSRRALHNKKGELNATQFTQDEIAMADVARDASSRSHHNGRRINEIEIG